MEVPIYSRDENGLKLRKIINESQTRAIIPSNDLKEYHFQNRKLDIINKVSEAFLSESVISWDYPFSGNSVKIPREGIPEYQFESSNYETHLFVGLGTFNSECKTEIIEDIVCRTAKIIAGFQDKKAPQEDCRKNTAYLIVEIPVYIKIHNLKSNEKMELNSNRISKFWNKPGDISCPIVYNTMVEDAVSNAIYDFKKKYFPKIKTFPYYIIEKDENPDVERLLKMSLKIKTRNTNIPDRIYRLWQKAYNISEGRSDGALSNIALYFISHGEIELALEYNQMAIDLNGSNKRFIEQIRSEMLRIAER